MSGEHEDYEAWQRDIIESLRPIDPEALFSVGLAAIDFRQAPVEPISRASWTAAACFHQ